MENPILLCRYRGLFHKWLLHFLSRDRKRSKRARPCPAQPCASPNRPMTRRLVLPCGVARLARVLTIRRLLRASLRLAPYLTARCLRHRPVDTAGARGNSPRLRQGCGGTQTRLRQAFGGQAGPRALFRPPRRCSARDKGNFKTFFKSPSKGLPEISHSAGEASLVAAWTAGI